MDTVKTGKFISELRREAGLTQEQLGEKIGVSNKTVSRWETGTYMPPIESLEMLSKVLNVSINEIIAGERLTPEEYVKKAEENIVSAWQDSSFTLKERQEYFKKRWLKRHAFLRCVLIIVCIALVIFGICTGNPWIVAAGFLASVIGQVIVYNAMMAYVERKSFKEPSKDEKAE